MYTRVDIIPYGKRTEEELLFVIDCIHDALCRLEKMANFYNPTGESTYINRVAFVSPVVLSEELYPVIDLRLEYNGETLGYFNIIIHPENYNRNTIQSVHLSAEDYSTYFSRPGAAVNLSDSLKEYASETTKSVLDECVIENALINMGNSSVLVLGNHPVGTGWKVNNIPLHNECLITSGSGSPERQYTVSPRDGKSVEGARQILIVTTNRVVGEVLSVALFAVDGEQRKALTGIYAHYRVYTSTILYRVSIPSDTYSTNLDSLQMSKINY